MRDPAEEDNARLCSPQEALEGHSGRVRAREDRACNRHSPGLCSQEAQEDSHDIRAGVKALSGNPEQEADSRIESREGEVHREGAVGQSRGPGLEAHHEDGEDFC
jgi:hypothetical protein